MANKEAVERCLKGIGRWTRDERKDGQTEDSLGKKRPEVTKQWGLYTKIGLLEIHMKRGYTIGSIDTFYSLQCLAITKKNWLSGERYKTINFPRFEVWWETFVLGIQDMIHMNSVSCYVTRLGVKGIII